MASCSESTLDDDELECLLGFTTSALITFSVVSWPESLLVDDELDECLDGITFLNTSKLVGLELTDSLADSFEELDDDELVFLPCFTSKTDGLAPSTSSKDSLEELLEELECLATPAIESSLMVTGETAISLASWFESFLENDEVELDEDELQEVVVSNHSK